ncbi:MAG: hypothetical protein AAF449_24690, partial [Myxococcota bacterium]
MKGIRPVSAFDVRSPFCDAIAFVVPAVVAVAAAAYGAVEAWSELTVIALVGVAIAPLAVVGIRFGLPKGASLCVGAFIAFSVLAVLQAISMPVGIGTKKVFSNTTERLGLFCLLRVILFSRK